MNSVAKDAPVAQRIERLPSKQRVGGSIPSGRAILTWSDPDTSVTECSGNVHNRTPLRTFESHLCALSSSLS